MKNFIEFNLEEELLKAIADCGYKTPTYIQSHTIPLLMENYDVIGQSQTGTGKTASFSLPILNRIERLEKRIPQALILCPTRELCLQVSEEIKKYAKYLPQVKVVAIYGGQPITNQIHSLKGGVDIVVGTPGRTIDHINRRTLRFNQLQTLVLDEADEMLNMGFKEDIETILNSLPVQRQTVLFSATMPKPILQLTKTYMQDPKHIKAPQKTETAQNITQHFYQINKGAKDLLMIQLLEIYQPESVMVFCNTKRQVDELNNILLTKGFNVGSLHGDMRQEARNSVMHKFKKKTLKILIATDVAARGIDIDSMDLVINYDLPQELEYYIHRIGRTGRAGKEGLAITFITSKETRQLQQIEKMTKSKILKQELPSKEQLITINVERVKKDLTKLPPAEAESYQIIEELESSGISPYETLASLISEKLDLSHISEIKAPPSKKLTVKNKNTTRIKLNLGKTQGISTAHIVSAIAESSGLSGKNIGKIRISDRDTVVEVPVEHTTTIIESLNSNTIKGRKVKVTRFYDKQKNKSKPKR